MGLSATLAAGSSRGLERRRNEEGAVSVRLFIGNLPYTATEAELRDHLSSVGEPAQIVLPTDRETGRPRGFAFVDYADRAVAEEAIRRFNQQPFKGRPLAVSEARPREDRPAGPRPGGFSGPRPRRSRRVQRPGRRVQRPSPRRVQPAHATGQTVPRRAAGTSGPMLHRRTSASRRARTPTAVRKGPIKERPVGRFTTPMKIGDSTDDEVSRWITSRRPPTSTTTPMRAET